MALLSAKMTTQMTVQFNEDKQEKRLEELKKREEEELASTLSAKYGISYLDLSVVPINIDALRVIKEADAREASMAVFNIIDKRIDIAVLAPENEKTVEVIEDLKKRNYIPTVYMVSHASLNKVWDRYKDLSYSFETKSGALDISNEEIVELLGKITSLEEIRHEIEEILGMKKSYRISRILEIILAGGLARKASDIHLEPEEDYVRLRYRLDGVLTDILTFDLETYKLLLSRIKLISELKLNLTGAQDGRFSIKLPDGDVEVRTSILPGSYSESVVLRVLNPNATSVALEERGIHPKLFALFLREIKKPNGMILVTGPTGSGKTTTLYSFLKKIHSPEVKIITIENPIEYHLPGIVQTHTDPDKEYTFASGLRSALRQDPDVILVGEIRDEETAEVAVNAALTGHLVLSTLHTNNAAGTFPRLIDLGVNPKVITSAVNISIAQRLIRTLCPHCKQEKVPDETERKLIDDTLANVLDPEYLNGIQKEKIWEAPGCKECDSTGFMGRTGIFEAIFSDEEVEKIILANPSEREIRKAATPQKNLTLKQDGVIKVLQGLTSIAELGRVVDLDKEE